jgi:uncharacterized repeat protein (TIGR01451 family)
MRYNDHIICAANEHHSRGASVPESYKLSRYKCLCVAALSLLLLGAWQPPSDVTLTAEFAPSVALRGETLILTLVATNAGDAPLEDAVLRAQLPAHTTLERAETVGEAWTETGPVEGTAAYRGVVTLGPGQSASLTLIVRVDQAAGETLTLDDYALDAAGLEAPVVGEPISISVEAEDVSLTATPTIEPTATATLTATASPTAAPTSSPTASPTVPPTAQPTQTATPTLAPTPTITLAPVEMPPTAMPTPTPRLSSEKVRVGTVTVLIFVGLSLALLVAIIVWVVRTRRGE